MSGQQLAAHPVFSHSFRCVAGASERDPSRAMLPPALSVPLVPTSQQLWVSVPYLLFEQLQSLLTRFPHPLSFLLTAFPCLLLHGLYQSSFKCIITKLPGAGQPRTSPILNPRNFPPWAVDSWPPQTFFPPLPSIPTPQSLHRHRLHTFPPLKVPLPRVNSHPVLATHP